MMKPGAKAALLLMAIFLTAIAACSREPKDSRAFQAMGREVAKLRKQVDALSAKPPFIHFTFKNFMPMMLPDMKRGFVSLVVFPEEAKIKEWYEDSPKKYSKCESKKGKGGGSGSPAVCPEREFHRMLLHPLISELGRCGSPEEKVELEIVGFASDSGISGSNGAWKKRLDAAMPSIDCPGPCPSVSCYSQKFNLVVANIRAANTKRMLDAFMEDHMQGQQRFEVRARQWRNYCDMRRERDRHADGEYSPDNGLMNRRAEIRIVSLPSCNFGWPPGDHDFSQGRRQAEQIQGDTPLAGVLMGGSADELAQGKLRLRPGDLARLARQAPRRNAETVLKRM